MDSWGNNPPNPPIITDATKFPEKQLGKTSSKDSFVYFMRSADPTVIRIGFTGRDDPLKRISEHESTGHQLLAIIPAISSNEEFLHKHFSHSQITTFGTSTSHYSAPAVQPYIDLLLQHHFACADKRHINVLPRVPWKMWSPKTLTGKILHKEQYCFFVTEAEKSEARDTWQTPIEIVDLCRKALGGHIDLDPASCPEANERIGADWYFTEKVNGLNHDWFGNVFLNPPYGGKKERLAAVFTQKLVDELVAGRVRAAVTVINLQSMCTIWFPKLTHHASAHAIWKKRIPFHGPVAKSGKGTRYGSSKNGTVVSYFGPDPTHFMRTMKPYAFVFREWEEPTG